MIATAIAKKAISIGLLAFLGSYLGMNRDACFILYLAT